MLGIDTFGASAPGEKIMEEYGFTVENVVRKVKEMLYHFRKISGMERFFYVNEFFRQKKFLSLRSQTIIANFLIYNEEKRLSRLGVEK